MPTIRISDQLNAEILSTEAGPGSGFAKYFTGNVAGFLASTELVTAFNKPISSLTASPLGLGLSFQSGGGFGATSTEWQFSAGARVLVQAAQANETIPGDDLFGNPLTVGDDQTFLAVAFNPSLSVGVAGAAGNLSFGFSGGGAFTFRTGRTFALGSGAGPTLRDAMREVLSALTIPGDLADLQAMQPGDVASVSGSGEIKASASFDVAAALNPLATPTLGLQQIGSLQLKAGASLSVGASFGLHGSYQIRVAKLDPQRVQVGYYRMSGSQFEFAVTASAGVSATMGKRDLIELLAGFSSAPKADVVSLVEGGLSDEQIADIKAAIGASIDRSLSLSLAASFATDKQTSAIFEYEFDLSQLASDGIEALNLALDGNLSPLTSRRADDLPTGITMLQSELERFQKKTTTWKINLLGIVNVLRVTELIRTGKVLFDPGTGDLLITDSITGKKLAITTRPFAADEQKLRKVMMQSMVLTAAYRVSGVQKFLSFDGSMTYFEQVANARRQHISDFLDNLVGLGLCTAAEKAAFLGGTFTGRSSVFLEVMFDDSAFTAMFLDAAGQPRRQEDYDTLGRDCVLKIVQPGDESEFLRIPLQDDAMWREMTSLGPFMLQNALPSSLRSGVPLKRISDIYVIIRWWSAAMSEAAEKIVEMRQFLAASGADAETLRNDNEFKKREKKLEESLADVVSQSQPDFLDAWGLLAMDAAAQGQGTARGILVTPATVLVKNRP